MRIPTARRAVDDDDRAHALLPHARGGGGDGLTADAVTTGVLMISETSISPLFRVGLSFSGCLLCCPSVLPFSVGTSVLTGPDARNDERGA